MTKTGLPAEPVEKLAWRVKEAARALGISERTLRDMIKLGRVQSVKIGRILVIPAAEVHRLATEGDALGSIVRVGAEE